MNEGFFIDYEGRKIKVSPVEKDGELQFLVDLTPPVTVKEDIIDDLPGWIEVDKGATPLATVLGNCIEEHDLYMSTDVGDEEKDLDLTDFQWDKTTFQLSNGTVFDIYHNLGQGIQNAFDSWIVRTDEHTDSDFCNYINEKSEANSLTMFAFPQYVWDQILKDYGVNAIRMANPEEN